MSPPPAAKASPKTEPKDATFSEDDETLAAALADAELPSLLPALAYLTGDMSLVAPDLHPPRTLSAVVLPQAGMSAETQARARRSALRALCRLRDAPRDDPGPPTPSELRTMMEFVTGDVSEGYIPLLTYELGVPHDTGTPEWRKDDLDPSREFTVVIIGAGMSGLAAAYRLDQAKVPYVVIERNDDVGGVWLENTYPGCRLDTSNFAYSYSFFQKNDWPQQFSLQGTILDYFKGVAEDLDIRPKIRFRTEVRRLAFDEPTATWTVTLRTADGPDERLHAHAVISAVGQLNRPYIPPIEGIESFGGPSWHTARWRHDVDLTGRRTAVIGTGASAYQVIPSIAAQVGSLTVFQRSAPYMMPTPAYQEDIAPGLRWLFEHVPHYHRWFRFYQFWTSVEGRRAFSEVDADWDRTDSVSEVNEKLRRSLVEHLEAQYRDRPDLVDKITPHYPPYAKRMLRDNGVWAAALRQPNVSLVTDRIERISERGIHTVDGVVHEVDVIIYGTGFEAQSFLAPISVKGRGGIDLHEQWAGEPRAFYGITVPNFPNLFCLYGPNTNLVVNGSLFLFSECAVNYVVACIATLLKSGARAMDCRWDVFDKYNERIDEANRRMAWGVPNVTNWYKNEHGRVTQNWPLSTLEYWNATRAPRDGDYEFL
jgi:4-hydroxyacetophenone monooxygenase